MKQIAEYRASRVDVRKMVGGAMVVASTDKGQVVIYLTDPGFENLVLQTKRAQTDASAEPVPHSDKPQS
jgi:hypothetical protein